MADSPPPPPWKWTTTSRNGRHRATFVPGEGVRVETKSGKGAWKLRWADPRWWGSAYLADDGDHFLSCASNLIPDADGDQELLWVYSRGRLERAWKLRELIPPGRLERTVSNYMWGACEPDLDVAGHVVVTLWDCRTMTFELDTGKLVHETHAEEGKHWPHMCDPQSHPDLRAPRQSK